MKTRILPKSENPAEVAREIFTSKGDLISEHDIKAELLMWELQTSNITEVAAGPIAEEAARIKKDAKALESLPLDARSPSAQATQLAYRKKICEEARRIADAYMYASAQTVQALEGFAALKAEISEMTEMAA